VTWTVQPLGSTDAEQLFIDRARAAAPHMQMSANQQAVVADICRKLDGIPLAIELAAARTRMMSVEQITSRLDDRFQLLTGGHTRPATEWSLTAEETCMHCVNCEQHSRLALLPARDRIHLGRYWRLAHAWSALPGWLVLISRRHVLDLAELTEEESTELGQLLRQASGALGVVVGCIKTYVMFFAEQPGFEHLHIHLVPRMPNFDKHHLGSGVFDFLKRPESE
jgi:hypothetical protein